MKTTARRTFLNNLAGFSGFAAANSLLPLSGTLHAATLPDHLYPDLSNADLYDETFWHQIKQAYTVSPAILNLNNGGVSPAPKVVQDALDRYNKLCNETPSYYMWRILDQGREPIRAKLAQLAGCSPEEIAINRNTSESLETIIFGLRLKKGDEVVLTKQDYPNMINAWKQREHRDGIVLKWLDFDFPIEDDQTIVDAFKSAFTEKTKIVHITHVINWNGQVLPARAIADEAHKHGIQVLVDAAHSFAQLDYKIPDLGADYFGTSLHKWLCAPIGSGLLYVKKEHISQLYPLMAAGDPESDDIRKFENLGTRSFAIEQAIGQAIDFHLMIGTARKSERLFYLKNYWANKLLEFPEVSIGTSLQRKYSGAIGLLQIKDKTPQELGQYLFNKHKIHSVPIVWENIAGLRVTPNVYTTLNDLDRFVDAVKQFIQS